MLSKVALLLALFPCFAFANLPTSQVECNLGFTSYLQPDLKVYVRPFYQSGTDAQGYPIKRPNPSPASFMVTMSKPNTVPVYNYLIQGEVRVSKPGNPLCAPIMLEFDLQKDKIVHSELAGHYTLEYDECTIPLPWNGPFKAQVTMKDQRTVSTDCKADLGK